MYILFFCSHYSSLGYYKITQKRYDDLLFVKHLLLAVWEILLVLLYIF